MTSRIALTYRSVLPKHAHHVLFAIFLVGHDKYDEHHGFLPINWFISEANAGSIYLGRIRMSVFGSDGSFLDRMEGSNSSTYYRVPNVRDFVEDTL
ncbi:hypothetical protein EYC84_007813 [Monilinia fructicola]|uniref:Uncharacterized protein n=1 Tax=Monilinia fructicola TaxID=38448 RepID=A0A5M9JKC2_MONFR|nr:hypothetical protein EYC84_007813 [Monilinia fructicola]